MNSGGKVSLDQRVNGAPADAPRIDRVRATSTGGVPSSGTQRKAVDSYAHGGVAKAPSVAPRKIGTMWRAPGAAPIPADPMVFAAGLHSGQFSVGQLTSRFKGDVEAGNLTIKGKVGK